MKKLHTRIMQAICLLLMGGCLQAAESGSLAVSNLRCEDLVDPIGIDVPKPRLSWQMRSDQQGASQSAYQILCATTPDLLKEGAADLWDSGKVAGDASRQIHYAGKTLSRGIPCYWTVRIWDEKRAASPWAPHAVWTYFDMAATKDWQAKWITHPTSSPWLRKTIELKAIPEKAYIYVNSVGFFQLFINGKRVGVDQFTPHVSQPDKRSFCLTYDVKDYLVEGKNAICLWLGQGWSGQTDIHGSPRLPSPAVRAQLELLDTQGEITTLVTDDSWRAKNSCMTYRGHWGWNRFGGEVHDGASEQPDWANADLDDSNWSTATVAKVPDTIVSAEMLQRSRVVETIHPVTVTKLPEAAGESSDNLVAPGEKIDIKITKALYGLPGDSSFQIDVSDKLQALADAKQYQVKVTNDLVGKDLAPGKRKQLELQYVLNGKEVTRNLNEYSDYLLAAVRGKSANWLVDMGKAMTGTFDITFPQGDKGQVVTMEFGDAYSPGNKPGALPTLNHFSQISEYICRGSGIERFKNQFNYASCRYILIRNAPEGDITAEDIKGYFITTDLPKASTFSCSDKTLNEIYTMIDHTLRCLMLGGYQVDCHSRERNGYGGDGQASLDTTLSFLGSDAFYRKWTQDWVDGQKPGGEIMNTSPASSHGGGPFWPGFLTAATLKNYQHYGDLPLVKRNYPAIKKWVEMAQKKTENDLQLPFCGGGYLGDWATPRELRDLNNDAVFNHSYMAYVLGQAAQLADIVGETSDAKTFRSWAAARNKASHKKFYDPNKGSYGAEQITYILPLMAGVVPDELTNDVFAKFEETLLVKDKGHLSTGLSGTYLMIEYLQSIGRDDLIYAFASKRTFPSWGFMIENGATATWECWNGKPGKLGTLIHNCYNSIGAWFIQSLAGIRPDPQNPGFKNAIIKPAFLKELTYVNGSHDSVYGAIQSHWKREGDTVIMNVKIPPNSTATVYLPAQSAQDITVNGESIESAQHVKFRKQEKDRTILDIGAGSYAFVCKQR